MTKKQYTKRFGPIVSDDFDRATCRQVGNVGHMQCGVCRKHKKPRFQCGCVTSKADHL